MNKRKTSTLAGVLTAAGALSACGTQQTPPEAPMVGMANPASEYCVNVKKGRLEVRRDAQGNEYAMCHLPDGTVVEEWELFRREQGGAR